MTDCRECARYTYTVGPSGWLEQCGPGGRSTAFMRAEYGVYGEPHCGPEGKLFVSTALRSRESSKAGIA